MIALANSSFSLDSAMISWFDWIRVTSNSDTCLVLGSDAHRIAALRGDIGEDRGLWATGEANGPGPCVVSSEFTTRYLDFTAGVERVIIRAGGRIRAGWDGPIVRVSLSGSSVMWRIGASAGSWSESSTTARMLIRAAEDDRWWYVASLFCLMEGDLCEKRRLELDERAAVFPACVIGNVALRSEVDLPMLLPFSWATVFCPSFAAAINGAVGFSIRGLANRAEERSGSIGEKPSC
jgi:hypothetical protein